MQASCPIQLMPETLAEDALAYIVFLHPWCDRVEVREGERGILTTSGAVNKVRILVV